MRRPAAPPLPTWRRPRWRRRELVPAVRDGARARCGNRSMPGPTLHAAWEGLRLVLSWPNILYPIAGTLLAMMVAFLPGISGVTLMALAVPVHADVGAAAGRADLRRPGRRRHVHGVDHRDPVQRAGDGAERGDAASTAIRWPQQGRARTAIGCAAMASAMGSSVGIFVLIALVPLMTAAILAFGPPELLLLLLWGLTTIAVITRGAVTRAAIATGIGLLLALVGHDARTGGAALHLRRPVSLGRHRAGAGHARAVFDRRDARRSASRAAKPSPGSRRVEQLAGSVLGRRRAPSSRTSGSSFAARSIGTVVGIIPGVGGTVASFLAYGQAVQTSRDRGAVRRTATSAA